MTPLDRIAAAGLVLRVAWLPSARCYRASATRTPESISAPGAPQNDGAMVQQFVRETARGETATVAIERLYAALVTAGVVAHEGPGAIVAICPACGAEYDRVSYGQLRPYDLHPGRQCACGASGAHRVDV